MQRSKIKDIFGQEQAGGEVLVQGWVKTRRSSKSVTFIQITDGSTLQDLQIVVDESNPSHEAAAGLTTGCSVSVEGVLVESPGQGQKYEIQAKTLTVLGESDPETYPLQKKRHSPEFLREIAHLRPRTNTFGAMARVRNSVAYAIHTFFQERGFQFVQTPIITASDAEGAGSMFQVTTLDLNNVPKDANAVRHEEDFFGKPAFLTVSGQLEAEIFALALSDVYTFGPTFRAENSNTSRHLAEFWMVEPEMAYVDLDENMTWAENLVGYIVDKVLKKCIPEFEVLERDIKKLEAIVPPFPRMTYDEASEILKNNGSDFQYGSDFGTPDETLLSEQFDKPIMIHRWPADIKAFYMKRDEHNDELALGVDMIAPEGYGEIIGGGQREDDIDVLTNRIRHHDLPLEPFKWYLDLRKYGSVPHSGFGLGLERTVAWICGTKHIRETIPFPRTMSRLEP